jgi:hypothetical protein
MRVGTRHIHWQGGEHDFCLAAVGNILQLEQTCSAGIAQIYQRLVNGTWGVNDVREPIRLGLIGGGRKPDDAGKIVKIAVDENPQGLAPSVLVAMAVLEAVLVGVPDDPVGKTPAAGAETGQASTTRTAASAAQQSSESAPASPGRPQKPTPRRSGN